MTGHGRPPRRPALAPGDDGPTLRCVVGAIIIAVVLVVAIPLAVIWSGLAAAGILGTLLTSDAEARHPDSPFTDLNT